jgi:hypothetical protein
MHIFAAIMLSFQILYEKHIKQYLILKETSITGRTIHHMLHVITFFFGKEVLVE